jgi:hypothetical protein
MKKDEKPRLKNIGRMFSYIYVDLKCLVNIEDFFKLIEREIKKFISECQQMINGSNASLSYENSLEPEINNFRDLFEALSDIEPLFELYLVI